jgi:HEAT repeat protein
MTSITRWKLLSGLLVAMLAHSWWPQNARPERASRRGPGAGLPFRITASQAGISLNDLVGKLLAARAVEDVRELAETLGAVGDDRAIDQLTPLLTDVRAGVPEAMLVAFGKIGSSHAVDVITPFARDARAEVKLAAVEALGSSHNARAEAPLIEVAEDGSLDEQLRTTGIWALGELGTDGSVAVLEQLAAIGSSEIMQSSINALARVDSSPSREAIARLIDSPSIDVARAALGAITVVDDEMFAKLAALIKANDVSLNDRAIEAIAHAGVRALPILEQVALDGMPGTRVYAVSALATIDAPEAFETLRNLIEDDDAEVVASVLTALSAMQTDEARDLLISAALSETDTTWTRALEFLLLRHGPEVDEALVEVVKLHPESRAQVLRYLVSIAHKQGTALALELAHSSDDSERLLAIRIFAEAGTAEALETALSLVRNERDAVKVDALALLDAAQPGNASVLELLKDTIRTGSVEEARIALRVLSRSGTEDARDTILGALTNGDLEIVAAAVGALERFRMTPEMTSSLKSVADAHPELRMSVMQQLLTAGSPAAIEIAEKLIHSTEQYDAESTFRVLENAGSPLAADLLLRVAQDREPVTRARALQSLASLRDKRAVEVAVRSLRDQEPMVRQAAASVLAGAKTDAARGALLDLSRSNDEQDRLAAVTSLRGASDSRTINRMLELTRDPNYNVAYNALETFVDYSDNPAALQQILTNTNVQVDLRLRAGSVLRERGRLDAGLTSMLEQLESDRYGYAD